MDIQNKQPSVSFVEWKSGLLKTLPNKCGVYQITCLSNNKIYIGSSQNIRHLGKRPHNALLVRLTDTYSGNSWEGDSLKALAKKSPISISTINRLRMGTAGLKTTQQYKLEILDNEQ